MLVENEPPCGESWLRACYYHLFRIAKIRANLTIVACKTLMHALVISRLDYWNALLYGINDRLLHRLGMIQHSAARIIMCIKKHDRQSITAVLRQLHWLPVRWRINYKIVVLVFRALHGLAPVYVSTLITPYEPRCALRSTGSALLCVPRHNLERYGRRSFSCAGPVLWNSLPEDMRLADSLNSFKSHLKTRYFILAYNLWLYAIRTLYVILYLFLIPDLYVIIYFIYLFYFIYSFFKW